MEGWRHGGGEGCVAEWRVISSLKLTSKTSLNGEKKKRENH